MNQVISLRRTQETVERSALKLAVKDVSKKFSSKNGDVEALANVSFDVYSGEFLCILGPSGCGKSTLLNLLAGLESPNSGQILQDGKPVSEPGGGRVVVFQESGLFPWLTVIENVAFGLKMRGVSKAQRLSRASASIEMVGLTKFKDAYPHQLSGGMKQRAAIARTLVLDPDILLMDEPFAALDAQTRDRLHEDLQDIWRRTRKTIIFVTHNVREAACLGDRIILFSPHPGRVHKTYDIDLSHPRHIEEPQVMDFVRTITGDLKKLQRG
jgi:NitT/TauT family transport system ATP-binding protein